MQTPSSDLFSARVGHWAAKGFTGKALYQRLAEDADLPMVFDTVDLAAIIGVKPLTVKQHRARGVGPDFLRISHRSVRYGRADICRWLASRLVRRAA